MDEDRRRRGAEMIEKVYAGDVAVPPPGDSAFADVMLEQLFAEIWTREALPVRDRRLLTMGITAALGEGFAWSLQVKAALRNGELTAEQVREVLLHVAQYAGYPRAAGLLGATEKAIAEAEAG